MGFTGSIKQPIARVLLFTISCLHSISLAEQAVISNTTAAPLKANQTGIAFKDAIPVMEPLLEMNCNCSWGAETLGPAVLMRRRSMMGFKIVGGELVSEEENYPMMAGLAYQVTGCSICGGSILTEFHVLTAAHCLVDDIPLMLSVGRHARCRSANDGGQYLELNSKSHIHPKYDEDRNHYDIGIVMTKRKIVFNDRVGPACIGVEPFTSLTDPILVIGWGKDDEEGEPNAILHKVWLNGVSIEECERLLPRGWINPDKSTQMCTYRFKKDACTGDSGGPLFYLDTEIGRLSQIALVSMGLGCSRMDIPAVNTAIYPFLGWMTSVIEKSTKAYYLKRQLEPMVLEICHAIQPELD